MRYSKRGLLSAIPIIAILFLLSYLPGQGVHSNDSDLIGATPLPEVTIYNTEVQSISSQIVGQEYKLSVALPTNYLTSPNQHYPVLYLLDPQNSFGTVTEYVRHRIFGREFPEIIIVGIGYPTNDPDRLMNLRQRDYTPTSLSGDVMLGGAAHFLDFITQELIPFVDKHYRTTPGDRAIAGHSLGGLFVIYSLFHGSGIFSRYIASSPSVWWDEKTIFNDEAEYAQTHSDLPARLYLSVGQLETDSFIDMVGDVNKFSDVLKRRAYPGLALTLWVIDDETHFSVAAQALTDGIRAVYQ